MTSLNYTPQGASCRSGLLPDFPGGMSLDQLRVAYQAEADRCAAIIADPATDRQAATAYRAQRVAALRLRDSITAYVQVSLW